MVLIPPQLWYLTIRILIEPSIRCEMDDATILRVRLTLFTAVEGFH